MRAAGATALRLRRRPGRDARSRRRARIGTTAIAAVSVDRALEVPEVSLRIARTILAQSIGLADRRCNDLSSAPDSVRVVCIGVVHRDHNDAARRPQSPRWLVAVAGRVKPDGVIACEHLAMDGTPFGVEFKGTVKSLVVV